MAGALPGSGEEGRVIIECPEPLGAAELAGRPLPQCGQQRGLWLASSCWILARSCSGVALGSCSGGSSGFSMGTFLANVEDRGDGEKSSPPSLGRTRLGKANDKA